MLPSRVLLPLGGDRDERALRLAGDVAAAFGVAVELFGAVTDPHEVAGHERYLTEAAARIQQHQHGVRVHQTVVVDPHGPEAVARHIDDTTLAVMATSARPYLHEGYLGSAAEHVIRSTHRPVLMTGPSVDPALGLAARRIIVPVDGSTRALEALPIAQTWSERLELPLWLFNVVEPKSCLGSMSTDASTRIVSQVRGLAAQVGAHWEVLHAKDPAKALASAAGAEALVIMSSHGRTGIRRLALGSVASDLTRQALCPVMAITST